MKKYMLLFISLLVFNFCLSQVGIGNTSPNATLDVSASNTATPSNTDGILIPKIDEYPATAPTVTQDGMLVYVTGNGTPTKGFYNWDNATASWLTLTGAKAINELSDGKSDTGGTNDGSSIFLGINAGAVDDGTNNQNVGIGWQALNSNTTGNDNIAIGNSTLSSNETGFSNIGIGREVLFTNLGSGNVGIGFHALFTNNTGSDNIAIGFDALYSNTTGVNNNAFGSQALRENDTGFFNNAFGRHALQTNTTGAGNVAMGHGALRDNAIGNDNVAIGGGAGDGVNGSNNVFLGQNAGNNAITNTNSDNVLIGHQVGRDAILNNMLYIDNSNTSNPLIYGEFVNDLLRVNGTFQVNNPAGSGYQLPTSDGTANQFLQTNGSGIVGWVTATSNDSPAFKVTNHANTIYGNAVLTTLTFGLLDYNLGGGTYNSSTGVYTIPEDGVYHIKIGFNANFSSASSPTSVMFLRVYVNGGIRDQQTEQGGAVRTTSYSHTYKFNSMLNLSAGDLVEIRISNIYGTGTGPTISGGTGAGSARLGSHLAITKVN